VPWRGRNECGSVLRLSTGRKTVTSYLPIGLALLASLLFALNFYLQRQGLKTNDPVVAAFLSVSTMAAMFWILAPLNVSTTWFSHPSVIYFLLVGLTFPAIAQFLQIVSVGKVGPALTSAFGSLLPMFAAVPAVLFLGEPFGFVMLLGFALMMGGIALGALRTGSVARGFPLWALLLPVAASAARGLVQPLTKIGLNDLPSPYFATLIASSVSTLVLALIVLGTGRIGQFRALNRTALWFVLVGCVNGAGILLVNTAISLGEITRVAPFVATVPLWVLFLGWLVFRVEKLGPRHIFVVLLVMAGGILVVTR